MVDNNFDLHGFLNDPTTQANKPAAVKFLQSKGIIDQQGNPIPGTFKDSILPSPPKPQTFLDKIGNATKAVGNFLTGSEQGVAKSATAAYGAQQLSPDQAAQNAQNTGELITHAHTLPIGNPRRSQLLKQANQTAQIGSQQANEQLSSIPSNTETALNIAGSAADLLGAGTYGKATSAMKAGELAMKAPTVVTAGEKVLNAGKNIVSNIAESQTKRAAQQTADKITEMVTPKLTARETAQAVANRGTSKTGILGKIKLNPDPYVQKISETIKKFVPEFNPAKTLSENINVTKNAVYNMASELKNKVISSGDGLVPLKEVSSQLNKIGKGADYIGLKGTQFEKQLPALKEALVKLVQEKGGKVSGLFDARKAFDKLVEKTYPNLYDKEYTPIRQAVGAVRDTLTNLTDKYLPEGFGLRDSLRQQSHLFSAIDNMSEKAASGTAKEIGSNALSRFGTNHPVAKRVLQGVAGAAGYEEARKYLPLP